eukprot:TRINITY_DN443_c1_g2_i1.p1 TRINITY_DN443_c1_g2~~TRINITY_DN443_c1_g2_i1.p1  ORF type:complete len:437 (-),score=111.10 TRINITY_DN443_c1_g2_i1:1496-2806(-)
MSQNKQGWLAKEGGSYKSWQKRWFVVDGTNIFYYTNEKLKKLKGTIKVSDVESVQYVGNSRIGSTKHRNLFQVITASRTYNIKAATQTASEEWVEFLSRISTTQEETVAELEEETNTGVADFEKIKVVGKGAFGKVYLVKKKDTGAVYAMKVLKKRDITERGEIEHTLAERSVLTKVDHPFLASLHYSFQTPQNLYFIMDFINGGELFWHLSRNARFNEDRTVFYSAEIVSGMEHLHSLGVIYRDLKPENLLISHDGHIVMTDFGLSKEGLFEATASTDTFCGTPEYLAPEIINGETYTKSIDWWSLGTLIFEMLNGLPPFYSDESEEIMFNKIVQGNLTFPDFFSDEAKDLISKLLDINPATRLQDPVQIKAHPFFRSINWNLLQQKKVTPPFIPNVSSPDDVQNIDPEFLVDNLSDEDDSEGQEKFIGFTYGAE